MGVILITDEKGKSHMVREKSIFNEQETIGNKISDFEILQVLSKKESHCLVVKVISKINHQIYAIRKVSLNTAYKNEIPTLLKLKHPNVLKIFKTFESTKSLYIVMEFMDNGDLNGLINASQNLGKSTPEEKIWDIFIQAATSLKYIHKNNITHKDIKPSNIFINNNGLIKLGDFKISKNKKTNNQYHNSGILLTDEQKENELKYISPDIIYGGNYDMKSDVYALGCAIYEMMFWDVPRKFDGITYIDNKINNNNNDYSNELKKIVNSMINLNKNSRPSSRELLNILKCEFTKKYSNNSSIGSVLCCLYSFENITKYYWSGDIQEYLTQNAVAKPISFTYSVGLKYVSEDIIQDWKIACYDIREVLIYENDCYAGNDEISPRKILDFLLRKLHFDINTKNNSNLYKLKEINYNNDLDVNNNGIYPIRTQMSDNNIEKIMSYEKYINNLKAENNSIISENFFGIMKTKTCCQICNKSNYQFSSFYYVTFNLKEAENYITSNQVRITDLIDIQNTCTLNNLDIYCNKCKKRQLCMQRMQFYSFPKCLIICLDQGKECKNQIHILYDLYLNLIFRTHYEDNKSTCNYKLIGILKRVDKSNIKHFISIYFDFKKKKMDL